MRPFLRIFLQPLLALGGALGAQKLDTPAPRPVPAHSDTVSVPLSGYQRDQLAAIRKQVEELNLRYNIYVMAIVASKHDPNDLSQLRIVVSDTAVLLVPLAAGKP